MKTLMQISVLASALVIFSCGPSSEEKRKMETSDEAVIEEEHTSDVNQNNIASGQITAAEWSDLNNWEYWKNLNSNSEFKDMSSYWHYIVKSRVDVKLRDKQNNPIVDETIKLYFKNEIISESKTNKYGVAQLWFDEQQNRLSDLSLDIRKNKYQNLIKYETEKDINVFAIENNNPCEQNTIDIAFVVDATGSMGDEIDFLKAELLNVISRVKDKQSNHNINLGSVFYRDTDDEYLTLGSDFSTDIDKTINFIKKQNAGGGGDFPEAVEVALDEAINELQWSNNATSRLLFLVLDAPPHHNLNTINKMHQLIAKAQLLGIKIIPIASSGVDKETEFLMRYMATATNGSYVFITNDSGIGHHHIEATVGNYKVEYLNDLLVRLINEM